jgi:hypothetical protein
LISISLSSKSETVHASFEWQAEQADWLMILTINLLLYTSFTKPLCLIVVSVVVYFAI